MSRLSRIFIGLWVLLASTAAIAVDYTSLQGKNAWSLGFDLKQIFVSPVGDFRNIMGADKGASAIYLAYRTQGALGYELGYTWSDRRPKTFDAAIGTQAFGATATVAELHTAKIRLKETYFDIYLHRRLSKRIEAKFGLGVGFVREGIKMLHDPDIDDALNIALDNLDGRTGITARILFGAQGMVSERIGLRALVSFQTLSQVKVAGTLNRANRQMLHNGYSILLGIYWTFFGNEEFEPL